MHASRGDAVAVGCSRLEVERCRAVACRVLFVGARATSGRVQARQTEMQHGGGAWKEAVRGEWPWEVLGDGWWCAFWMIWDSRSERSVVGPCPTR